MRTPLIGALILLVGCPDEATDGPRGALTTRDASMDARPTPADAAALDARLADVGLDAVVDAAEVDAAPDAGVDPCAPGDRRGRLLLGPAGADPFTAWVAPAAIPLVRLAQGGSITRFDLVAVGAGPQAESLTVTVVDLDTDQELAFGQSGAVQAPCRPGLGRVLADRAIDYAVEFAADDLIGRRVRLIATLQTPAGPAHGGVEGVLEAAQ